MEGESYINEDEIFEGDVEKLNAKIGQIIKDRVAKGVEEAKAAQQQPSPEGGKEDKGEEEQKPKTYTREEIAAFDTSTLGYAVFSDEDEDVKDTANALFEREARKLPEGSGLDALKGIADKVSQRLAKMSAAKAAEKNKPETPYDGGPLPMNTSGAAAAHITNAEPKSIDEAEALADKIAASFKG